MKKAHVLMIVVVLIVLVSIPLILMVNNIMLIEKTKGSQYQANFRMSKWEYPPIGGMASPRELDIGIAMFTIELHSAGGKLVERLTTSAGEVSSAMMTNITALCQYTITIKGTFDFESLTVNPENFKFDSDEDMWHQWSTSYVLTMTSGSPDPEIYWQLDIELGPKLL